MDLVLELEGITLEDIQKIEYLLDIKTSAKECQQKTRADISLFSAGFILGVLKLTPPIIKEISNLLLQIRKSKYFTIKVSYNNGKSIIEGSASEEKIIELSKELKKLNENSNVEEK